MHKIMKLFEQICDTEKDTRDFANCALKYKESDRELADTYITLARADLDQCSRLQAQVVRLVSKHKSEVGHDTKELDEICEWHVEQLSQKLVELKILVDSYK